MNCIRERLCRSLIPVKIRISRARGGNGNFVGIELTKVMRDPETAWWEGILERKEHMEYDEASREDE